jgi:DTW domain-containing protein
MDSVTLKMNLCLTCRRRLATCLCPHIRSFETDSRFLILMHPKEFKKEKIGTGRFTHLILKNSKIIVDVGFDQNDEFQKCLLDESYESFVLYPGEEAINLSGSDLREKLGRKKKQFIVIDGTWPCAKKMMKLSTCLHQIPRVSFKVARTSEFSIKHQPHPACLSTVESIHQVLLDLNRAGVEHTEGKEDNLMQVFRETVRMQKELASDPAKEGYRRKPFSFPEERRMSKKWTERSLFFKV